MKVLALALVLALLPSADGVFRFADDDITEASGLVDDGRLMATVNDSGDDAVVYVVDRRGRTTGRVTYAADVRDVEAVAPAPGEAVYAADIGDNVEVRSSVTVYRVPLATRDVVIAAPSFELVYPDGPHDAESLFNLGGRLYIVTKGILGGGIYALPRDPRPDRPNRLRRVGAVSIFATDAAAIPGTPYVLVRGYGSVHVVSSSPGWRTVGRFALPRQEQGEAISVGPGDRIRITSEGRHARVLEVAMPGWLRSRVLIARLGSAARAGASAGAMLGR